MAEVKSAPQTLTDADSLESSRRTFLTSVLGVPALAAMAYAASGPIGSLMAQTTQPASSQPAEKSLAQELKDDFAEECQVGYSYRVFAQQAMRDKRPGIARLFRTLAEAERVHADLLLLVREAVKDTAANLQASADYEHYLASEVLPKHSAQAEQTDHPSEASALRKLTGASEIHSNVLKQGLAALHAGKDMETQMSVCPVCGTLMLGAAPDSCPVCASRKVTFLTVE